MGTLRGVSGFERSGNPETTVHIGVLALQGDFERHLVMLNSLGHLGVSAIAVKTPAQIELCDGVIIPGGESTTVGKLMVRYGVDEAIRRRAAEGMAVFGTCMGMIVLAKEIEGSDQFRLGLMDMTVRRNAFGRQVDSFERDLEIEGISQAERPFRAVFIRAPVIEETGPGVEVIARVEEGVVLARDGNVLLGAFHPELTDDERLHRYFLEMVASVSGGSGTEG